MGAAGVAGGPACSITFKVSSGSLLGVSPQPAKAECPLGSLMVAAGREASGIASCVPCLPGHKAAGATCVPRPAGMFKPWWGGSYSAADGCRPCLVNGKAYGSAGSFFCGVVSR